MKEVLNTSKFLLRNPAAPTVTGGYGWHWVYRDALAEHGLHDLARHGMFEAEDAEPCR